MQALEIIKQYDLEDALEVEIFAGVKERTLFNWFHDKQQLFRAVVIGAAVIKKKLNLTKHEIERRRIEKLTQQFVEDGGNIEVVVGTVLDPEDVPIKAQSWGAGDGL